MFTKAMEALIQAIRDSLATIRDPRFYETERGFQGELGAELRNRLPGLELDGAVVEQEYQKRMKDHGFRIRPDMIIHVPFEDSDFSSRSEGNFVVIELKHRANANSANKDFKNLSAMCEILGYPLAVFININSDETHIDRFEGRLCGVFQVFAVKLVGGEIEIHEQQRT